MSEIRLVVSDVDGTLVTSDKRLTDRAIAAVEALAVRDVHFALTSARPPRALVQFVTPLRLTTPLAAFNGALMVEPSLEVLRELTLPEELVAAVIALLDEQHVSVWVYQGTDWFVRDLNGPHVARDAEVCQFMPSVRTDLTELRDGVVKIVGVSDDDAAMGRAVAALRARFGDVISASTSQSFFLDVTSHRANKGAGVDFLAHLLRVERDEILTLGDMANDVSMFGRSGVSVAMGNATDGVKLAATQVTTTNDDEGFARAIERFVLA